MAQEEREDIFYVNQEYENENICYMTIYCDLAKKGMILKQLGAKKEGWIKSFSYGNIRLEFEKFEEGYDKLLKNNAIFYYTGDIETNNKIYQSLKERYSVKKPQTNSVYDMFLIALSWGILVFLLIIFTTIEIVFLKKEYTLKISLGASVKKIILINIFGNFLIGILSYVVVRYFMLLILSGYYLEKFALLVWGIGLALSSLLYLSFAKYDIKLIFSNDKNEKKVLNFCYGVKIGTSFMVLFGFSLMIMQFLRNTNEIGSTNITKEAIKYHSLYVYGNNVYEGDDPTPEEELKDLELEEESFEVWKRIYRDYYDQLKPITMVVSGSASDHKTDILTINDNAKSFLEEKIKMDDYKIDKNAQVLVFIPKNLSKGEDVNDSLPKSKMLKGEEGVQKIIYEQNISMNYLHVSAKNYTSQSKNPIIIYIKDHEISKNIEIEEVSYIYGSIFLLNKKLEKEIKNRYSLGNQGGLEMQTVNLKKEYEYYEGFIQRVLRITSTGCMILLIIQISLISLINTLEYQLYAMEYSLKTVLGYSVYQKYRKTFRFCLITDLSIGIIVYLIYVILKLDKTIIVDVLELSILLTIFDCLVYGLNCLRTEKREIVKTLKGGCL